jgi:hypothetical protein
MAMRKGVPIARRATVGLDARQGSGPQLPGGPVGNLKDERLRTRAAVIRAIFSAPTEILRADRDRG